MAKVHHSVTVSRPVEDVFAFVANNYFKNAAKWNPSLVTLRQTLPGPVGIGTTGFEVQDFKGKRYERHVAVREFVPNKRFMLKSMDSSETDVYQTSFTFQQSGLGTRVTVDYELYLHIPVFRYLKPLAERMLRKDLETIVGTRMKSAIERSTL